MMKRTLKCVKFELTRFLATTGVFLGLYCFFYLMMIALYLGSEGLNDDSASNMNFCFAAAVFAPIILMIVYKGFTNGLMMFGNTRQTILNSLFISCGVISAAFALLSLLSDYVNAFFGKICGFKADIFLNAAYGPTSIAERLLFFFTLLLTVCAFGLFYGAMEYRIGRAFRLIFWLVFVLIWMVTPVVERFNAEPTLLKVINWYFGLSRANGILHMSLHFFVTAVLLGGVVELVSRRQPQNA
jgi:hypothetical protein